MKSFVRISVLLWADILVLYALFVMQKYLTDVWDLSFTHAAGILNVWNGISMMLQVFFLFLVDELFGNFGMVVISSITYSVGIGFVTMSTPTVLANSTGTCKQYEPQCIGPTQKALFYTGMVLIAMGMAGNLVSVRPFLHEQQEDWMKEEHEIPALSLDRLFILYMVLIIPLVGAVALPYIKSWTLRFGIPAICTLVSTFMFLTGSFGYVKYGPRGSPVMNIFRVLVAAFSKQHVPFPLKARLYRGERDGQGLVTFKRTRFLRCLDKAAIIPEGIDQAKEEKNRWKLCTVSEVEEAKIAVRMIPMWLTFIVCGIVSSIGNTYFVSQADHLNRHIGKWNVPLQALLLFSVCLKKLFSTVAIKLVWTNRTYGPPVGIGMAMVFSILCCITAAKIEERRLDVVRKHNLIDKPDEDIPMSIYWLLFQFLILAGLDSFFEKGVAAFYYDQAPDTMRNCMVYLTKGVYGLGFMLSVLSVHVVGKISEKGGKPNWFQFTLNKSRLDRYYWVLAALSSVNLIAFAVVAMCYQYQDREVGDYGEDDRDMAAFEMEDTEVDDIEN